MKIKKIKNLIIFTLVLLLLPALIFKSYAAAPVDVSNQEQLKQAIATNQNVNIIQSFDINEEIIIPATYTGNITGNNNEIRLSNVVENMFLINGATVEFRNITLNAQKNGRIIRTSGATVSFLESKLKNGTTQHFTSKEQNGIDKQNYQGGALFIDDVSTINSTDTVFESNVTKSDVPSNAATADGGAIYAGSRSTINIIGGKFLNNISGGPTALGGAICIEGGAHLNINKETDKQKDKTIFEGNHNIATSSKNHGGNIQVKNATANIYATTFNIAAMFDIGGGIHVHSSEVEIKNSAFIINNLGDGYGISGGAIASLASTLNIDSINFEATGNSKVIHAGGFIDFASRNTATIKNSNFIGIKNSSIATYGGGYSI